MKKKKLINGEIINSWIVINEYGLKNRCMHYVVKCICGSICIKNKCQINKNKSCFICSRKKQTENGGTRRTHGACSSSSDLYKTYMARNYMIKRCQGTSIKNKKNYLDRNIKVCDRWLENFENFFEDMGKRPEETSLDRIDNDKGYFKENCRWASIKEQNDNKRGCLYHSYNGEKLTISRWAERWGITRSKAVEWIKREGINWVVENLDNIKKCRIGMSNAEYNYLGLGDRKGSGNRDHAASRNKDHPLHKMYKSWDYLKNHLSGMCESWKEFTKFVKDMGEKPEGKRLLRKNTKESFCKENCFWG